MLCLRILVKDILTYTVGIERCGLTNGILLVWIAQRGQRLNHEPRRIVGVLNGELTHRRTVGNKGCEVDSLHAWLILRERNGYGNVFTVGKQGKIVLFAVAERIARHRHLAHQKRIVSPSGSIYLERNSVLPVCWERFS